MVRCSVVGRSDACINSSTKYRYPAMLGTRPADVCGWITRPSSSSAARSLRIVAELKRRSPSARKVFDPTGVADAIYSLTKIARISRCRGVGSLGASMSIIPSCVSRARLAVHASECQYHSTRRSPCQASCRLTPVIVNTLALSAVDCQYPTCERAACQIPNSGADNDGTPLAALPLPGRYDRIALVAAGRSYMEAA